jgi:AraC-like DNA-binding protein
MKELVCTPVQKEEAMSERRDGSQRIVRCSELHPPGSAGNADLHRIDPMLAPEAPVLQGHHHGYFLRPGLSAHCADVRDLCDLTIHTMQEQSLRLVVVLDGEVDVSFGSRRLGFGAAGMGGPTRARQPQAAFVSLREPEPFIRRGWRGKYERKVSVTFSREWLRETCLPGDSESAGLRALIDRHLAVESWTPTARVAALAEQMIHPPAYMPVLQRLYLESRAIELAAEALHVMGEVASAPQLRQRERKRINIVRDLLESGDADDLGLDEIARRAGTNASTLQKQFRAAFGMTIFEYLRCSRLTRARVALEREDCSITEAACLAGYTSPANFATAYRRLFGMTPRQSRAGF